jgi:hypothetical protein
MSESEKKISNKEREEASTSTESILSALPKCAYDTPQRKHYEMRTKPDVEVSLSYFV